ncbi:MAG: hypothetical protein IJ071_08040 [Ruminococcus sp.]|nr:hypothetical protein [Ruminococcus sp.]
MRTNKKGRKLYKTKEKNYYGKSPVGKVFSAVLSVLLIGGLGFIGYSVAEPLLNYNKKVDDDASNVETTTEPTEVTTVPDESSSAELVPNVRTDQQYKAAALSVNAMNSINALNAALEAVPADQGIEYVEVPLKASGGNIYYSTKVYEAQSSGAVQSSLTLDEIVSAIESAGYKPAAVISTFWDNVLPSTYPQTGYVTVDDGSQWIDDNYDSGGKPWVSPYADAAVDYVCQITDEAVSAGFDRIVCSDFMFPHFRPTDLELLDQRLAGKDRFMALTSAANLLYDKITTGGSRMIVEVSAAEILSRNADILQPMMLTADTVIVDINMDEISWGISDGWTVYEFSGTPAEKSKKCLGFIGDELEGFNVAVRISGSSATTEELIKAKEEIADLGYTSFVIG